jgi:hypothetical protein
VQAHNQEINCRDSVLTTTLERMRSSIATTATMTPA